MDAIQDASIHILIILFACNFSKNPQSSVSKLSASVYSLNTLNHVEEVIFKN